MLFKKSKPNRKNRNTNRVFSGESLEQRQMMAADVQVDGGNVTIRSQPDSEGENFLVYEENDHVVLKDVNANRILFAFDEDSLERIWFYGGDGDDVFENQSNVPIFAKGGKGNDTLIGGTASDVLYGGWGNDYLIGGDGHDYLSGSIGHDILDGMIGNDRLAAGWGNDVLTGGSGRDWLYGDVGNDFITGGVGDDYLAGGDGNDELVGDEGRDRLFGGDDNDMLTVDSDDVDVDGGRGQDTIRTVGDYSHLRGKFTAFPNFKLQKALPLGPDARNVHFEVADYNRDGVADLFAITKRNTSSGRTEINVLNGADDYQSFLVQRVTPLGQTGDNFDFEVADWNGDGILDVIAIQKNQTGSNSTEVHILNGATNYHSWLLKTRTKLHETGSNFEFEVGDFNGDGVVDLMAIKKSQTGSGSTEVHILNGARNFQSWLLKTKTALHETGGNFEFDTTDLDRDGIVDLVVMKKDRTSTGSTEIHVLSGARRFQQFDLHSGTSLHETGSNWDLGIGDWNNDDEPDLIAVAKWGTGSKRPEVHVVSKGAAFEPTEEPASNIPVELSTSAYALMGTALAVQYKPLVDPTILIANPITLVETIIASHQLINPEGDLTVSFGIDVGAAAGVAVTAGTGIVISYDACSRTVSRGVYRETPAMEGVMIPGFSVSAGVSFGFSLTVIQGDTNTFAGHAVSAGYAIDAMKFNAGYSRIIVDGDMIGFQVSAGVGLGVSAGLDTPVYQTMTHTTTSGAC